MPSLARVRPLDMVEAPDMQFIFPLPSLSLTHFSPPLLRICQNYRLLIGVYVFVCVCVCASMCFQFRSKLFKIKECLFLYGYSQ